MKRQKKLKADVNAGEATVLNSAQHTQWKQLPRLQTIQRWRKSDSEITASVHLKTQAI